MEYGRGNVEPAPTVEECMTELDREILMSAVAGQASEFERHLVRARRLSDPAYDHEFEKIQWLWSACESRPLPSDAGPPPSPESIIREAEVASDRARTGRSRSAKVAITGAVAVAVLGIFWGELFTATRDAEFGPRVIHTEADEIVTVTLEDGTLVRLAPNTRLAFAGARDRTVELDGRAYFAVAHREGQPFQVRLANRTITVLGTRFDVEARDGQTRVAVVEGEVRISGDRREITARADQVASGPDSGALVIQHVDDVFETVDWLGQFLAFETTPLADVADELQRRFGLHMMIADDLLDRTVTGWFSQQTPEGIVASLCSAVGAHCTIDGQEVRMERGPMLGWDP
jgi:transmembrane sensor